MKATQKTFKVGDFVEYGSKVFEVLGYAASKDSSGIPLVEIAWNDYDLSVTEYLAVPENELTKAYRWDAALENYPNIKKLGLAVHDYNSTWMVDAGSLEMALKELLKGTII